MLFAYKASCDPATVREALMGGSAADKNSHEDQGAVGKFLSCHLTKRSQAKPAGYQF